MRPAHVALALLIAVVWGVNFVTIDIGLREFPPLLFAALRFAFVAVPGVFLVPKPPIGWKWLILVGVFLGVGSFGLLFLGMRAGMPAGLSSLVLQSQAMFTALLSVLLLRERLTAPLAAGTVIATLGLVVIGVGAGGVVPIAPFLLVIAGALCWAVANIGTRASGAPAGLGLLVWSSVIPPIPLAALSLLVEGPAADAHAFTAVRLGPVLSLVYLVAVATVFGFGAWNALLRRYAASVVAPYSLVVPVFGITAAWLVLGERPDGAEIIGSLVIFAGLALVVYPARGRVRTVEADRGLDPESVAPESIGR